MALAPFGVAASSEPLDPAMARPAAAAAPPTAVRKRCAAHARHVRRACRSRTATATASGSAAATTPITGEGYAIYVNGKLLAESNAGITAWRQGRQPRGSHVWADLRDEFKGGKVTIAVTNFPMNNA